MEIIQIWKTASAGIATGKAFFYKPVSLKASAGLIGCDQTGAELDRYRRAEEKVKKEISVLAENSEIFQVHLDLVEDPALQDSIVKKIIEEHKNAELALEETSAEIQETFQSIDDDFFRERAVDIKDVCRRIMLALKGLEEDSLAGIRGKTVLFADQLTPSDTANMDLQSVTGFVTRTGGENSHVAIMARGMNLPALVGVGSAMDEVKAGDDVIVDALDGRIVISPDEETIRKYSRREKEYRQRLEMLKQTNDLPPETADGFRVRLYANAGNLEDIKKATAEGAEGIGLLRSEFLYMESDHLPTEEEQFVAYKCAAELCGGEVIIRTLDIGGDKALPYFQMETEENPFLGWRAIRILLEQRDIFRTQLLAILRASAFGKISIMYPMIISVGELEEANAVLSECKAELTRRGIAFDPDIKTGIMVETPAAVLCADDLAHYADFFSIGTNDLTQYMLAVDRGNKKTAQLYDSFHPAVIRSIRSVIEAGHRHGIPVGMCGEFAGNADAVPLLLGFGLDEFSMSPSRIPEIRYLIRASRRDEAQSFSERVCRCVSPKEVRRLLKERK
ncbi:phosphoenolpyruvate--protein phosphotransferase [Caproiciproducens galactitolivorans]|uniref:Phosphoenolpyruvate-protein phosphotransferase n=1 Tax=Caproiciproducens galactitolivorans TaxID=642589 RepID=A0A4Z0Y7E4_9FIRM|nr:phosphoenolpyruvate--protein phosphotransferase [Caproiciproducens galactitolivorans]QEY33759.1 phosphoenolpyruvate--protein phosphotransferase [Caproiciproducens galactitolivorans]TGJ75455.1 phosphoenolpyruvate-protein phosphotransferase [Caproiciproducens galactitolivorans]